MTRWLDEDQQQAWRAYLATTRLLFDELDRQLQRDSGIPHTYYEILVRLSEAPERRKRMSELADAAQLSRSRLSHAVARLEQAGWVRRESVACDKRGQTAVLTDDGFAALAAAAPGHVEAVRGAMFDKLTAEQVGQLRGLMDTIRAGLPDPPC